MPALRVPRRIVAALPILLASIPFGAATTLAVAWCCASWSAVTDDQSLSCTFNTGTEPDLAVAALASSLPESLLRDQPLVCILSHGTGLGVADTLFGTSGPQTEPSLERLV